MFVSQRKEYEKWKYVSSDVIEGDVSSFLGMHKKDDDDESSNLISDAGDAPMK